jgi:hypothetical protein
VLFKLLPSWQCLLARYFPNSLFEILFASAVAGDKALSTNTDFRKLFIGVLKECLCNNAAGYLRDVWAYVGALAGHLEQGGCQNALAACGSGQLVAMHDS